MSVRLMTPLSRPDMLPTPWGMAAADIAGATVPELARCVGVGELTATGGPAALPGMGREEVEVDGDCAMKTAGVAAGVGGPEDAGEGASTTHMRWERVATSLATVWARVE